MQMQPLSPHPDGDCNWMAEKPNADGEDYQKRDSDRQQRDLHENRQTSLLERNSAPSYAHDVSNLRHAKRASCLVVADTGADQHDQIAGPHFALLDRAVERHGDASGTGVAILFHDGMRALRRHAETFHDSFNRRLTHLGEDEAVDVAQIKTTVLGEPLDNDRPRLLVQLGRIAVLDGARSAPAFYGFFGRGFEGPTGIDSPIVVLGTVGAEGRGDKSR